MSEFCHEICGTKRALFFAIVIIGMILSTRSVEAASINKKEKNYANSIMSCIKKGNTSDAVFVPVPDTTNLDPVKIINYVDETCGPYYRIRTCSYRSWQNIGPNGF